MWRSEPRSESRFDTGSTGRVGRWKEPGTHQRTRRPHQPVRPGAELETDRGAEPVEAGLGAAEDVQAAHSSHPEGARKQQQGERGADDETERQRHPEAEVGINVDTIVQNVGLERTTDMSFTVGRTDLRRAVSLAREQVKREGAHVLDINVDYAGRDNAADMSELTTRIARQVDAPGGLDAPHSGHGVAGAVTSAATSVIGWLSTLVSFSSRSVRLRMYWNVQPVSSAITARVEHGVGGSVVTKTRESSDADR